MLLVKWRCCILSLVVSTPTLLALLTRHGVSQWVGVSNDLIGIQSVLIGAADYVFQWAIVLPLELVVAGFTVAYWNPDINVAVWISVFLVAIIIINVFGVIGYAEEEFWSSILKLGAVVTFMITGLVLGQSLDWNCNTFTDW